MLLFQMNVSILNQDVDIFDEVCTLNELIVFFESIYVFFGLILFSPYRAITRHEEAAQRADSEWHGGVN